MQPKFWLSVAVAALIAVPTASAADLPWGAEKAGNAEGTIPAYVPNSVSIPASFDPSNPGKRPDPFAGEKPLYTISASNVAQYADKLTPGIQEMFKLYPTFQMQVYPTHRSVSYPDYVVENSKKNATSCKAVDGELRLQGCYGGFPFPDPKTGNQVMWNHLVRYQAYAFEQHFASWFVDPSGTLVLQGENEVKQDFPFYDPNRTEPAGDDAVYWRYIHTVSAPARRAGEKLLIIDYLDNLDPGRRVWQYLPGQRRVKLSPDLAYDTPNPQSGGSATMDDANLFLGALDRYDWTLKGKKEILIPYNNFKVQNGSCPTSVLLKKNFFNPDCVRWELHRVWVVEANVKPSYRHVYAKRVLYFDEDAPGAGVVDNYDAAGQLYRVVTTLSFPTYEAGGMSSDVTFIFDLQTGAYATFGNMADYQGPVMVPGGFKDVTFSQGNLAGSGIR